MKKVFFDERIQSAIDKHIDKAMADFQAQLSDKAIQMKNENDLARYRIETHFTQLPLDM